MVSSSFFYCIVNMFCASICASACVVSYALFASWDAYVWCVSVPITVMIIPKNIGACACVCKRGYI